MQSVLPLLSDSDTDIQFLALMIVKTLTPTLQKAAGKDIKFLWSSVLNLVKKETPTVSFNYRNIVCVFDE